LERGQSGELCLERRRGLYQPARRLPAPITPAPTTRI
jgi:hypothetical protein